mmetsp:Transcript_214/g.650  ORF Transcript_214/g.650 Transcript_214/m.650 type:complete len:112 (-) Transcript_214:1446-1781(-)
MTPLSITKMREQLARVLNRCATMMTVHGNGFRASRSSMACWTSRSEIESSCDVDSSRHSSLGRRSSARQMATRARCPPDSRTPCGPNDVSKPSGRSSRNCVICEISKHSWK